jgi:hypothetical protein
LQSAEYVDQTTLSSLKIEQTALIQSLKNKSESLEKKIPRLCEILDKRLELNDSSLTQEGFELYTRNQISTEIGRYFTRLGLKIAPWVHDYCPPWAKDSTKIHNNNTDNRAALPREIDQFYGLTGRQRQILEQLEQLPTSDLDTFFDFTLKVKNKLQNVARDRNHLLPGQENREDFKTKKPNEEITEYWESVEWFRNGPMLKYQEFVKQFPPPKEKQQKWINGMKEWGNIYYSIVNLKYSLTLAQWISRVKYLIHQSKHGAAVYDLVETEICDNCWDDKLNREREGCNAEMMFDFRSPTQWRCGTCGGVKGKTRGLTREQCGDNKAPTLTYAEKLIFNLPNIYEAHDFYASDAMKRIYGRKIWLGGDLSKKA